MRLSRTLKASAVFFALIAIPQTGDAQGLMVTGYADLEATVANPDGEGNKDFYFDNHHFNLIMVGQIVENLLAAGEVEYEHAGEEIALEYGYFAYTGITNLRIMAGKFIVPFGRFNKDLHPTFINKIPGRPLGFNDILPQTYNDAGLWVSGVRDFGTTGSRFVYDAFVVNGLMGPDGSGIRGMRDADRESRTGARDDNKAVGGRLGLEFGPVGFDVGTSVYTGGYSDDAAVSLRLTLLGVDAAFRSHGFEVRGELVTASQEATAGDLTKTGWYAQAAHRIRQWEPTVRYSQQAFSGGAFAGDDANDRSEIAVGVNFHLSAASVLRAAYYVKSEATGFDSDNNGVTLQWVIVL